MIHFILYLHISYVHDTIIRFNIRVVSSMAITAIICAPFVSKHSGNESYLFQCIKFKVNIVELPSKKIQITPANFWRSSNNTRRDVKLMVACYNNTIIDFKKQFHTKLYFRRPYQVSDRLLPKPMLTLHLSRLAHS